VQELEIEEEMGERERGRMGDGVTGRLGEKE